MTRTTWLTSTNPVEQAPEWSVAHRSVCGLSCACVRRYWPLLTDERSRRAVEVAERIADDDMTEGTLLPAWEEANDAAIAQTLDCPQVQRPGCCGNSNQSSLCAADFCSLRFQRGRRAARTTGGDREQSRRKRSGPRKRPSKQRHHRKPIVLLPSSPPGLAGDVNVARGLPRRTPSTACPSWPTRSKRPAAPMWLRFDHLCRWPPRSAAGRWIW